MFGNKKQLIIDTHSHVNFNAYKDDSAEVIRRALDEGVFMINVGSQYSTSKRAVEMLGKYPVGVYAAIGLHPMHLSTGLVKEVIDEEEIEFKTREEVFDYEQYKELAQSSNKVVAIGECGLDYYYKPKTNVRFEEFKEKQKQALISQIDLAQELNLPLIIHCRSAHEDMIEILNYQLKTKNYKLAGVLHCFTGTKEDAQKYIDLGLHIGLNGIIFKFNIDNIIKDLPMDKIVLETDCPYLTLNPMEGRNEPSYIKYVAQRVAQIKGISYDEVINITTKNAKQLFGI